MQSQIESDPTYLKVAAALARGRKILEIAMEMQEVPLTYIMDVKNREELVKQLTKQERQDLLNREHARAMLAEGHDRATIESNFGKGCLDKPARVVRRAGV